MLWSFLPFTHVVAAYRGEAAISGHTTGVHLPLCIVKTYREFDVRFFSIVFYFIV